MSQFKRFNSSENNNYDSSARYPEGTLTWDPDNGLRIHDGNQNGGQQIGIRSYQNLQDLPTNLATIQSSSNTNHKQFLRYNKDTYQVEYADDFKVVPFASISYPNGVVGDKVGDIAFTSDSIYYCHAEPNFIGTATLGDASGYNPGAWIVLTSIPAAGPVQVGQRLTDGNITSTVEEIIEGWPGYTGQRMIVRMSTDVAWHSGLTGTVLSVISSGESVSTGNWTQFTSTGSTSSSNGIEIKSSNFTAVAGKKYWVDTTAGAVTMTLPASPTAGDWVSFYDAEFMWGTNQPTVNGNGNNVRVVNMAGGPTAGWATPASTVAIGQQGAYGPTGPLAYSFMWNGSVWSGFM